MKFLLLLVDEVYRSKIRLISKKYNNPKQNISIHLFYLSVCWFLAGWIIWVLSVFVYKRKHFLFGWWAIELLLNKMVHDDGVALSYHKSVVTRKHHSHNKTQKYNSIVMVVEPITNASIPTKAISKISFFWTIAKTVFRPRLVVWS